MFVLFLKKINDIKNGVFKKEGSLVSFPLGAPGRSNYLTGTVVEIKC